MSALPSVGALGVNADADATQKSLEQARAAISAELESCVSYKETDDTKLGVKQRLARVKCVHCPQSCELAQSQNSSDGEWTPEPSTALSKFGWQVTGAMFFCSITCAKWYAHKMADHGNKPLPAVERLNDASYARRMYVEAKPPAAQVTTPAAPPVQAQQGKHAARR